jgi:hypothetical protein
LVSPIWLKIQPICLVGWGANYLFILNDREPTSTK